MADIVGRPGRRAAAELVPKLRERYEVGLCIANGENAAGGAGITENIGKKLHRYGIDVITSGNHVWDKRDEMGYIERATHLLRPANYPPGVIGIGSGVFPASDGTLVGVLNLQGRTFLKEIDCPFRVAKEQIAALGTRIIVVDFHAEATSEKEAMGWYLDGLVSAVIGTHTHVQTCDERVLPGGTAYITDAGMTGAHDSVIGMEKESAIRHFLTQVPVRFDPAKGDVKLCGVVLDIDEEMGKARGIERVKVDFDENVKFQSS